MSIAIHGFCDQRFEPLRKAFVANFEDGLELGASLSVTLREETVVDLWAGWADLAKTRPWEKDTIVLVYSSGKIAVTLSTLILIDRGKLELDAPVARYWPEFGQNGKEKVTILDALTHRAGVPSFQPPVTDLSEMYDWERITAHVAAQPHRFGGERVLCYHPITFGHVLGEVIRRVDGRMPNEFFREEIARPAKIDFQLGLIDKRDISRVAEMKAGEPPAFLMESEIFQEIVSSYPPMMPVFDWEWLSAVVPASNAYANGRSLARLCAILANGGEFKRQRYVSAGLAAQAGQEHAAGEDLYAGHIRWGLGFALHTDFWPTPTPTTYHWGGAGGSWGMMDPVSRISLGFAPNCFPLDPSVNEDVRIRRFSTALARIIATHGLERGHAAT